MSKPVDVRIADEIEEFTDAREAADARAGDAPASGSFVDVVEVAPGSSLQVFGETIEGVYHVPFPALAQAIEDSSGLVRVRPNPDADDFKSARATFGHEIRPAPLALREFVERGLALFS